jgi:hypothetical protein
MERLVDRDSVSDDVIAALAAAAPAHETSG